MWTLIRAVALAVLVVVAALSLSQGSWLFDSIDRLTELVGLGPVARQEPSLTTPALAGSLAAGVAAASLRPSGRAVGHIVTLLHELGHTIVAAALGGRPAGIVLRHDASGHATARWHLRPGGGPRLSFGLTAFVGMPAPAVAAASAAGLLTVAGPHAVVWSVVAAAAIVAILARSPWSLVVAAGLAGVAVMALAERFEPWIAGAVVALITAVALRSVADAGRRLGRPIPDGDDARAVRRAGPVPPRLVQVVQVGVTAAASMWAVWLVVAAAADAAPHGA